MKAAENWSKTRIGDLGVVMTGGTPREGESERFTGTWPFITPTDLNEGTRTPQVTRFISDEAAQTLSRRILPPGSVCFTCIGATIGKACLTQEKAITNQQINSIVVDRIQHDPAFVYYRLVADRDQIKAIAGGAATPIISKSTFENIIVAMPPLPTQRKIAAMLSAYDDLIENNNRRIKLVEEMAQRIYGEWFMDFRYPGHEGVPLVDSELGQIPDSWSLRPLSSLAEVITRGVSPKYVETSNHLVINQRCIRDGKLDLAVARPHASVVPPAKMVRFGDVLINSTGVGTLGRVAQVLLSPEGVTVDSHVTIVRPAATAALSDFFGLSLLERESDLAAKGVGSTGQTELSRAAIGEVMIAVPPMLVQRTFADRVAALRRLPLLLAEASMRLRTARDLLLPRLISGEIDVTDLNIAMPAA